MLLKILQFILSVVSVLTLVIATPRWRTQPGSWCHMLLGAWSDCRFFTQSILRHFLGIRNLNFVWLACTAWHVEWNIPTAYKRQISGEGWTRMWGSCNRLGIPYRCLGVIMMLAACLHLGKRSTRFKQNRCWSWRSVGAVPISSQSIRWLTRWGPLLLQSPPCL